MTSERRYAKIAIASWSVACIEWYDFFVYGTAAALVFPDAFFPARAPLVGTLLSFATFGVAFVARPLGGALFGHIGDTVGRKKALVIALLAMGVATTIIGLLPSYSGIGVLAPVLLVILRFVQGVAIGGQQGGVIVLATESVPADRRGFYGSFASAGTPGGAILANLAFLLVVAVVPGDEFRVWGWRLPFLASLLLISIAIVIQLRQEDTAEFRAVASVREKRRSPVIDAIQRNPGQILLTAGCYLAVNLNYYMFSTFVVAYAANHKILDMRQSTVLAAVLIASTIEMFMIPLAGLLSDRFGRRRFFTLGAVLLGIWSFAFWPLVNTRSFPLLTIALVVGLGLFHSTMYGPQPALFAEAFSTRVRYSGVSLGVQFGALLGGAFAPFIATALYATYHSATPIAVYVAAGCAVTLACGLRLGVTTRTIPQPAESASI